MARHNPYHFVPVKPGERAGDIARGDVGQAISAPQVTHDRYLSGTVSGRLVCRLVAERPVVVGACQSPGEGGVTGVEPFLLGGRPAIPATSLKGLVSSTLEGATNSALRVLDNAFYSYRKTMLEEDRSRILSALGMVLEEGGKLRLRPLTLPLLKAAGNKAALPTNYVPMFDVPNLKVYIGSRQTIGDPVGFRHRTFRADAPIYYGMRLAPPGWAGAGVLDVTAQVYAKGPWVLGQTPVICENPRPWNDIPDAERANYTRGILRVLGIWDRDDMPSTKKHEIFIPYPDGAAARQTFEIPDDVLERFHQLADDRTSDREELPYEPRDTRRNDGSAALENRFRLKAGDLVYFAPNSSGKAVGEISLSAIWRGRVETVNNNVATAARAHDFFAAISKELLPFSRQRAVVTVAEQMFGFVEQLGNGADPTSRGGLALQGRVRFSHALLERVGDRDFSSWRQGSVGASPFEEPSTLRILSTPKPPSPALYFKKAQGQPGYIRKPGLRVGTHHPQGRKVYLHHRANHDGHWKTGNNDNSEQKSRVRPLQKGAELWFHVEFSNLSRAELGALCYALRPTPAFRHKLGMGKPLGLGTVRIDPVALLEVARDERYSEAGMFAPRHARVGIEPGEDVGDWPMKYRKDVLRTEQQECLVPTVIASSARQAMAADIRGALELLGDPSKLQARTGPLVVQAQDDESETFRWFVANDLGSKSEDGTVVHQPAKRFLRPIGAGDEGLPMLDDLPWAG